MASVNRVMILGRLGADPELRYTPNGAAVCSMSLATTERSTDREGNKQEQTEWHRVVVWNKQAENCAKYLAKGRLAYVEGKLRTRSWDDKNTNQKRYATEIVGQTVQFVGGNQNQGQDQNQNQGNYQNQGNQQPHNNSAPPPNQNNGYGGDTSSLDDIPF